MTSRSRWLSPPCYLLCLLASCVSPPEEARSVPARGAPARVAADAASEVRGPERVQRVVDGDTLVLVSGERVRILGIDTPEMNNDDALGRRLARDARQELERLLAGGPVKLVAHGQDRYGRTLAYVHAGEDVDLSTDVGLRLLASGHARLYPTGHPRQKVHAETESRARTAELGVWSAAARRALGWDPPPEAELSAEQATEYVGRQVRVTGSVHDTHRSDKALFVNMGPDWRRDFSVVIFADQLGAFPSDAATAWKGRRLAVTGKVQKHRGRAEIIVRSPSQLEWLD